jgi:hypothetical protein
LQKTPSSSREGNSTYFSNLDLKNIRFVLLLLPDVKAFSFFFFFSAPTFKEYIKMKEILFSPSRLAAAIGVFHFLTMNDLFVQERER